MNNNKKGKMTLEKYNQKLLQSTFAKRATFIPEGESKQICNSCDDTIVFAMSNNNTTFSVGITTILQCLKVAEDKGAVPKLSDDWWIEIINTYYWENFNLNI